MRSSSESYPNRKNVLGYPVDLVDATQAVELIERAWAQGKSMHLVTLNAEMVIQAQKDSKLDQVVRHAHLIVPDGAGPVLALSMDGYKTPRVPGIELAQKALSAAARQGIGVALVGGKPEVMDELHEVLPKLHPGINIVHSQHGYFQTEDEERIAKEISEKKPGLVLVALGVPKQEYFINNWQHYFSGAVVAGVGGSFDVWTGRVQRAPEIFQKLNLEWFYRLLKEPFRFQRMCKTLPSFALQVIFSRLTGAKKSAVSQSDSSAQARKRGGRSHSSRAPRGNERNRPKRPVDPTDRGTDRGDRKSDQDRQD